MLGLANIGGLVSCNDDQELAGDDMSIGETAHAIDYASATPALTSSGVMPEVISANGLHTCRVRSDYTVACWGWDRFGQSSPPSGTFTQVSAGAGHTCGVRTNSTVACWGWNDDWQALPPGGTFIQVSAGAWHTCGVKTDGTVACWGRDDDWQASPPAGTFTQVSAGSYHTCGIRTEGSVACWRSCRCCFQWR